MPAAEHAPPVHVVGCVGGATFGPGAAAALAGADVVVGSRRHLGQLTAPAGAEVVELVGPLDVLLDGLADRVDGGARVVVIASGDPGFFGIVRRLRERFPDRLAVHPAPSAVALAFARLGDHWDDALVVSAHGRPLAAAARAALGHPKVAVLTAPDSPPQAVGRALLELGCRPRRVAVATRLGEAGEAVTHTDLDGLAAGTFDPMSVVVLRAGTDAPVEPTSARAPTVAWGRPESAYEHRAGMITKAETRAVCLAKLALPATGVLWDLGAGSGSVAIEAAGLAPGLRVIAVEERAEDAARITANARAHGVTVEVVTGRAPAALDGLADPDRVFVGGGGLEVLDAALARLRPGGAVVATYALVDRAAEAWRRLGHLVELSVARGVAVSDLGVRLAAENPVFVAWGPDR